MDDMRQRPYPREFNMCFGPDSLPLDVDAPDPGVAGCWLPWPRGDLLAMGDNGLLAWEWLAAWCPTELAKIPPNDVYDHFRQKNDRIREAHRAMLEWLLVHKPQGADPDEWEDEAYDQAWAAVRAEWIEMKKEVEEPVYDTDWIDDIENTTVLQLAELAGHVMNFVAHRPNLKWPKWTTYWGMDINRMRDILHHQLTPLQRHLVYSEAKRLVHARDLHTDPNYQALAQYPTPNYKDPT